MYYLLCYAAEGWSESRSFTATGIHKSLDICIYIIFQQLCRHGILYQIIIRVCHDQGIKYNFFCFFKLIILVILLQNHLTKVLVCLMLRYNIWLYLK